LPTRRPCCLASSIARWATRDVIPYDTTTTSAPSSPSSSSSVMRSAASWILLRKPTDQLVLGLWCHVGVAVLVVGKAGDVELVALSRVRHLGDLVAFAGIGQIVVDGLLCVPAWNDFDLVRRRDHNFLRHVADDLIHHEHHGHAKIFGEIESLDRQVETFLGRVGQSAMIS
jgi:hypothetical protein